ncbi:MAG: glycosyltransferase family 4 protein [Ilumatobacter fluminis]|uniref:glycosyltransferase family 4 protein n=1 Tax=Ilumatobacter fluminis TaxID=467091 RepID=UPI0032ECB087
MTTPLRCDLVLEQTLGHITHTSNLRSLIPAVDGVEARFVTVPFEIDRRPIPIWDNWTVRAGRRARRSVKQLWREGGRPHAMFVHTQVPAVLMGRLVSDVPTVISLDATPRQYDALGHVYNHTTGPAPIERVKLAANRRSLSHAQHVVTWSAWTRDDVIAEYGVPADQVTVIPPGVDLERWQRPAERSAATDAPVRLLFVGGDVRRKGGDVLIDAVHRLRADPTLPEVVLDIVSNGDVEDDDGVVVHRGLGANSPELIRRYHDADIFCLPTRGDCLPMVLAEAAAAGLPLISTDVGAIPELVRPGRTGALVPAGESEALAEALRLLVVDGEERRRLGDGARALASAEHDAAVNARRIVDVLGSVVT